MYRTHFPRVGQVVLSSRTFYPRNNCPVGQNILGKCVPWTHFPADRFFYDTGSNFDLAGLKIAACFGPRTK